MDTAEKTEVKKWQRKIKLLAKIANIFPTV